MKEQPKTITEWEAERLRLANLIAAQFSVNIALHPPARRKLYLDAASNLMKDRGWVKPEPKLVTAGERLVPEMASVIDADLTRLAESLWNDHPVACQIVKDWRDGKIGGNDDR